MGVEHTKDFSLSLDDWLVVERYQRERERARVGQRLSRATDAKLMKASTGMLLRIALQPRAVHSSTYNTFIIYYTHTYIHPHTHTHTQIDCETYKRLCQSNLLCCSCPEIRTEIEMTYVKGEKRKQIQTDSLTLSNRDNCRDRSISILYTHTPTHTCIQHAYAVIYIHLFTYMSNVHIYLENNNNTCRHYKDISLEF